MDYRAPGTGENYRQGRGLDAETLALWRDVVRTLVPPGEVTRAADVGCGVGRLSRWLAEALEATVVAVDPSPEMLAQAEPAPAVIYVVGTAEALPIRTGAVDLAFLSMVYHHLVDPADAVAELHRTLRPRGRVLVRTVTRETLDGYAFMAFFPEARALDERRLPGRSVVRAAFAAGGFAETAHRVVDQRVADHPEAYCARVGTRALSSLRMIPDVAFARGLAALEAHCRTLPADRPFVEPVDVLVFQR
jgi:ubiquinone/menaquinone biosynthesis C-methylase UbiE